MTSPSTVIGPFVVGEKPAPILYSFQDSNGLAINLTGYTAKFEVREQDAPFTSDRNAAVVSPPTNGVVQYTWVGDEFPTPGHYLAEFWVGNGGQRWASILIEFDVRGPVGDVPGI
jgi:baseplate upper protein BppU